MAGVEGQEMLNFGKYFQCEIGFICVIFYMC